MPLDRLFAAALRHMGRALAKLDNELFHPAAPALMLLSGLDMRLQNRHELSLPRLQWRGATNLGVQAKAVESRHAREAGGLSTVAQSPSRLSQTTSPLP